MFGTVLTRFYKLNDPRPCQQSMSEIINSLYPDNTGCTVLIMFLSFFMFLFSDAHTKGLFGMQTHDWGGQQDLPALWWQAALKK